MFFFRFKKKIDWSILLAQTWVSHLICNLTHPVILLMGHRQTLNSTCIAPDGKPLNVAPHLGLFCLLKGISSKNEIKV